MQNESRIEPVIWRDKQLHLIDQRALPQTCLYLQYDDATAVAAAITDMVVRGAPAIGIAAAYGVVLAARLAWRVSGASWREAIKPTLQHLSDSRPTAVNLHWAIQRMQGCFAGIDGEPEAALLQEAIRIHQEDLAANLRMGQLGAALIGRGSRVLTHCNAGALATGGYGTALGVIRAAHAQGKISHVYADETRPWLQGARLTAWELIEDGIAVELLADSAAAWLMKQGQIDWVIVGSDRIAANGDVANKIGTYGLAIQARHHGVKFMVVAPTSTLDMSISSGEQIPVEVRGSQELLGIGGAQLAAEGASAWNPVFDITPAEFVDVIVTERGVVEKPDSNALRELMSD